MIPTRTGAAAGWAMVQNNHGVSVVVCTTESVSCRSRDGRHHQGRGVYALVNSETGYSRVVTLRWDRAAMHEEWLVSPEGEYGRRNPSTGSVQLTGKLGSGGRDWQGAWWHQMCTAVT